MKQHQFKSFKMNIKYNFLICLLFVMQHLSPASTNSLRLVKEQLLTLHNCNKDTLIQYPDYNTVTDLNVHHCYVPTLENAFFIRFTALNSLEIVDSQLSELEDYALHGLKHLRSLSLAHNNLTEVKSWTNEQMSALNNLDLKRNAIRVLTLKSFVRFPNLQRLNLAGNLLEDIDDGIFRWMPYLKYLNLGKNHLITLENRNFHGMHRLSYLALHFNFIENIESQSFASNIHLKTLRLEGNRLRDLDFLKVHSMNRLQHLNLSFNALESLDSMTFAKNIELVDLDLSHNKLTVLEKDVFLELETLVSLNVSHNSIHSIASQSLDGLTSLEYLELNNNHIQHLHGDIFNVTRQLQHINLSNNMLNEINATLFSGLAYLNLLDLSQNQLSDDEYIENLADELQCQELQLNLSDNHYRIVNITALLNFGQVEMTGNWWSCKWLIKEMLKMPKTIHFARNYVVQTEWSLKMLETKGISCYDEDTERNIIILDMSNVWEQRMNEVNCGQQSNGFDVKPSPPPLVWPKIYVDRFDSRSVVIWMLIAIALAFSALRIARKLLDRKERQQKILKLREGNKTTLEQSKQSKSYEYEDTDSEKDSDYKLSEKNNKK